MLRMLALLAAVLAVTAISAGCGGGSDTSAGDTGSSETGTSESSTGKAPPVPLTNAEFIKQGNAICAKGLAELEKGFKAFTKEKNLGKGQEPDKAELAEAIETILIPGISKQLDGIGALTPPAGEEEAVEDFLKGAEAELKKAEKDPTTLTTGTAFKQTREEAGEIGISSCPAG